MHPKLINGKVWIPDSVFGGYRPLPENDPKYMEILLWIDSQRFVELLHWVYNRNETRSAAELRGKTKESRRVGFDDLARD